MYLFFDIDDTLLKDGDCTELMYVYLKQLRDRNKVILCTMRPVLAVEQLRLSNYADGIIAAGGAYASFNGDVLWHECFTRKQVKQLLALRPENTSIFMYSRKHIYTNIDTRKLIEQPFPGGLFYVMESVASMRKCIHTIVFNDKLCNLDIAVLGLTAHVVDNYTYVHSRVPDKGRAITRFCRMLELENEETMSFGDSVWDVPMFKATKYSVGVGSQRIANFRTDFYVPEVSAVHMYAFGKDMALL